MDVTGILIKINTLFLKIDGNERICGFDWNSYKCYVRKYLLISVCLLRWKVLSDFSVKNRHIIYNSIIFLIEISVK
jgi:hypothetical protein